MNTDLTQLKADEAAQEAGIRKPDNSRRITQRDYDNIRQARVSARELPTREQTIDLLEKLGCYPSPQTAYQLRQNLIPGYDYSKEAEGDE